MKKTAVVIAVMAVALLGFSIPAFSHCELPCGIYDDQMRLRMMEEHVATIEKSMKKIIELSAEGEKNYNQLVRWVDNKEHHAEALQEIVWQYFMTQRVKQVGKSDGPGYERYVRELELLHQMLVSAMKAKQTTDIEHADALKVLILDFEKVYFERESEKGPGSFFEELERRFK